jgi:hypothetical protein
MKRSPLCMIQYLYNLYKVLLYLYREYITVQREWSVRFDFTPTFPELVSLHIFCQFYFFWPCAIRTFIVFVRLVLYQLAI